MTRKEEKKTVYVVTTTEGFIPHSFVYRTKDKALESAKEYAEGWDNEIVSEGPGEIYFNQEEEGNMDFTVTVEALNIIEDAP